MRVWALVWLFLVLSTPLLTAQEFGQVSMVKTSLFFSHDGGKVGVPAYLAVVLDIRKGWHVYGHSETKAIATRLALPPCPGVTFGPPLYPPEITKSFMGQSYKLYEGRVVIMVPIQVNATASAGPISVKVLLTYQACNDQTCRLPQENLPVQATWRILSPGAKPRPIHEDIFKTPTPGNIKPQAPAAGTTSADSDSTSTSTSLWHMLLLAFLGGILTSLTPCVYPMIPVTIGYFSKQSEGKTRWQVLALALIFVAGIVTLYTAIGGVVLYSKALFGKQLSFNFLLQSRVVLGLMVAMFMAMGLSMFGLFELRLPAFLTSKARVSSAGSLGAFLRGFFLGIVAAPCMGPALVAILTFALTMSRPLSGVLLLGVYAAGVGVLFVIMALSSSALPRSGAWMHGVEILMGVLIFVLGLYFLWMLVSLKILALVTGALLFLFSLYLAWEPWRSKERHIARLVLSALVLAAALFFTAGFAVQIEKQPAPVWCLHKLFYPGTWIKDYQTGMALAREKKMPVLVDVWAKWCVPCLAMDHTTFKDARIRQELQRFVTIKIDVTQINPTKKAFMEKYRLFGPPSFVIFDRQGKVVKIFKNKVATPVLLAALRQVP